MRFLISRVLVGANRATMYVPLGSKASEEEAKRAVNEDALAFRELVKGAKVLMNGVESKLSEVLTTLGLVAVEHSIHCIDQDEPIQLASPDDLRAVLGGGKLHS